MKKVNLGSGPNGIAGWINVDYGLMPWLSQHNVLRNLLAKIRVFPSNYLVEWPKLKLVDIRKKFPFKTKSIDYLYCSHVLEHFEKEECKEILRECRRVLKKDGIFRIVLPDLNMMIKNYKNADEFCNEFYGFEKDKFNKLEKFFIRGHLWMYDFESIKKMLIECGFKKVSEVAFQKGSCVDIKKLDYGGHRTISMYIECQ